MNILYLLHTPYEPPGAIETWAAKKGFKGIRVSAFAGDPLPKSSSFDCLIVMGGPQSARDLKKHPYLEKEIALMRDAIKVGLPVLGFCLGAQLMGAALGAQPEKSPFKEVGVFPVALTKDGVQDPLLAPLQREFLVFHWHSEMPGLTKDAVVLARSAGCPRQIIRYAPNAYGFQCHPEMTRNIVEMLVENCPEDLAPGQFVETKEALLSHDFAQLGKNMHRLLDNLLSVAR